MYEELATNFEFAKNKVTVAKVDADAQKDLGRRFGIQGFPTLKWFDGKSDTPEDYKGGRDLESLTAFITEKTSIAPRSNKPPSDVFWLNDQKFNETVGKDKNVLVAFTAPWCGRTSINNYTRGLEMNKLTEAQIASRSLLFGNRWLRILPPRTTL